MSENNGMCKYLRHELMTDPEILEILRIRTEPDEIPIKGSWHKTCENTSPQCGPGCTYVREVIFYKDGIEFGVPVACVDEMKKRCKEYSTTLTK